MFIHFKINMLLVILIIYYSYCLKYYFYHIVVLYFTLQVNDRTKSNKSK